MQKNVKHTAPQRTKNASPSAKKRTQPSHPTQLVQRFQQSPQSLAPQEVSYLQQSLGNRGMIQLLRTMSNTNNTATVTPSFRAPTQQQAIQRTISAKNRTSFALRFRTLVARLAMVNTLQQRDSQEITALKQIAESNNGWLEKEAPRISKQLATVAMLLPEGRFYGGSPQLIVKNFITNHNGQNRTFKAVSSSTFSPEIQGGNSSTGDGGGQFVNTGLKQRETDEITLLQNGDDELDMNAQARINIAIAEVDKAFHHNRDQSVEDLKLDPSEVVSVFVGPEWFFRRPDRPYLPSEKNLILKTFTAVSAVYPDMVIMPGSIIWAKPNGLNRWTDFTNSAPVFFNGRLINTVDKSANCGDTWGLVDPEDFSEKAQREEGSTLFDIGNLKFALEICANHDSGRAKSELARTKGKRALRTGQGVDVHLVTGAGQVSQMKSIVSKQGGLAISSDSSGMGSDVKEVIKGTSFTKSRFMRTETEVELETRTLHDGHTLTSSQGDISEQRMKYVNLMKDNYGDTSEKYLNFVENETEKAKKNITIFYKARKLPSPN